MTGDVLIRQLEYLVALARERHFGRAAKACHVSQPALSAAIRKLEHELDVTIVQRGQRFGGFTTEGQRVVGWAHRILAERDGLRTDLDRMRDGLSATLRIGAIPTAVPATPLLCERLAHAHPQVRVHVEELSSREIVLSLRDFRLDVGMTYLADETSASLAALELYRERYYAVLPASHALAERQTLEWPDVARLPLCLLSPAMRHRRILDARVAAAGGHLRPQVEGDTMGTVYAQVASRQLATVVSQAWLFAFAVPPGKCVRPIDDPTPGEPVGVVRLPGEPAPMASDAAWEVATSLDVEADVGGVIANILHPPAPRA